MYIYIYIHVISGFLCEVGDPSELEKGSGFSLNIFGDKRFSCDGQLKEWTFFVKEEVVESMYLSVWRRNGTDTFNLVGYNKVNSTRRGMLTVTVPEEDRIKVKTGDCLGVHFDGTATQRGSICYGRSNSSRTFAQALRHSRVMKLNGSVNTGDMNKVMKTVSLRASLGKRNVIRQLLSLSL